MRMSGGFMDIDKSYEKKIGIAERELGDKLFFLLWFITLVQLVLIVWEWLNLMPSVLRPLNSFLGLSEKTEIKAIELTTTMYLIIQLAYMGKKEITRWVRKSDTVLTPEEYIRRIRRGDVAVLLWGILYITAGLFVAIHLLDRMPAELSRTFIQVTALYTCAFVSKTALKTRMRQTKEENHTPGPLNAKGLQSRKAMDDITNKEKELLEFIQENETVTTSDCIRQTQLSKSTTIRMLRNLLASGLLRREGMGKSVTYSVNKSGIPLSLPLKESVPPNGANVLL